MKLNSKEFEKLLDQESNYAEFVMDKEKVQEKIKHFHAVEKREDLKTYGNQDKRRLKR